MKKRSLSIKTERFLLREIVASDIQNIYKGLSDPQVIKYYGINFSSLEATKEQMLWYQNSQQFWWAICSKDTKEFYGAGGLNTIEEKHKKAEIGLWILPDHWGKGIMTEVMPFICNYGFNELDLHRIEGYVESNNGNCKRALAKLDFDYEGTMKECEIKNGIYINVDIYAKIKEK